MNVLKLLVFNIFVALFLAACGGSSSSDSKSVTATSAAAAAAGKSAAVLEVQALAANALAPNSYQSLQVTTAGLTNRYLRHSNGLARTDVYDANSAALDKADATFRVVSGLADASCFSIESQNYPGRYLHHVQKRVRSDARDGTAAFDADATWCSRAGLSGSGVSLEAFSLRGSYLRHYNAEVWLATKGGSNAADAAGNFEADASWNVATPWSHSGVAIATGAHALQVTTANLGNRYARHANGLGYTEVVDAGSAALLKADATFNVVAGLADPACYSLEAQNYPGNYLRHQDFRIRLAPSDGSDSFRQAATFCSQAALSGTGLSLEASNLPGFFVRHYNGELWLASGANARPSDSAFSFREDATWAIANPWVSSGGPVLASIQLAQSQLFNSNDSALVLVRNKAVLVKVNATSDNPAISKPSGTLQVQDANGNVLSEIALAVPSGSIPASVASVPSLATAYSAVLPASQVVPGLRLTARLSTGQSLTVNPRVGGGVAIDLVTIPIQIGGTVGQIVGNMGASAQARIPVSSVTQLAHATYVSSRVTVLPATEDAWSDAFGKLLGEIADLHTLEGAGNRRHYVGFIPKATYGLAGLGYVPGTSTVAADIPSNSADGLRTIVNHELGHNFNLSHAACGGAGTPDPAYPYPNAQLGTGDHYTWGYLFDIASFFDPRSADTHDIMSYCGGTTFSDYNTHLMQAYLTPADALSTEAVDEASGELLLVSGQISGAQATLWPLKSYAGAARLPAKGAYTLRVVTEAGTLDYPFAPLAFDHADQVPSQNFSFSIPNPGRILSLAVVKAGSTLMQAARPAAPANTVAAAAPAVQVNEQAGVALVRWDATRHPYLTVTVVAGGQRVTLAQDLRNGSAALPLGAAPAGGAFEFSLSDGVNTTRQVQSRASAQ